MIMHEKKDNYNLDMGGLFSRNSTTLLSDRLLYLYGYVLEECSFCGRWVYRPTELLPMGIGH